MLAPIPVRRGRLTCTANSFMVFHQSDTNPLNTPYSNLLPIVSLFDYLTA